MTLAQDLNRPEDKKLPVWSEIIDTLAMSVNSHLLG